MSDSFSEKPYSSRREAEPADEPDEPSLQVRREPRMRINYRRLLGGFALLFMLTGALLVCFIRGGLLNWQRNWDGSTWIELNQPGHVAGFVFLGLGAVIVVFLFSLEKRP